MNTKLPITTDQMIMLSSHCWKSGMTVIAPQATLGYNFRLESVFHCENSTDLLKNLSLH